MSIFGQTTQKVSIHILFEPVISFSIRLSYIQDKEGRSWIKQSNWKSPPLQELPIAKILLNWSKYLKLILFSLFKFAYCSCQGEQTI